MSIFNPEFHIRLEGRAIARYLGPRDPDSVRELFQWCRREKVKGQLQINFSQGGVTDIILDEKRRMTEEKEDSEAAKK